MDLRTGADQVEQARHDVHLDIAILERSRQVDELIERLIRVGDDHAFDAEHVEKTEKLIRSAEDRDVTEICSRRLRLIVDEPDQVEPVLWMELNLAGDELTDVPCTDDHGVLKVVQPSPIRRPGARTREGE